METNVSTDLLQIGSSPEKAKQNTALVSLTLPEIVYSFKLNLNEYTISGSVIY